MSESVWKYELEITDAQSIVMPAGARLLTVQMQNGRACLWARVRTGIPTTERRLIYIHGTGHPLHPFADTYVSTFQVGGGALTFHVFDGGVR